MFLITRAESPISGPRADDALGETTLFLTAKLSISIEKSKELQYASLASNGEFRYGKKEEDCSVDIVTEE